jgi:hypothetical protein
MGTYDGFFRGSPDQVFPGKFWARTTSDPPVPNEQLRGTAPFGASLGVHGPSSHQLGRPPGRLNGGGVWGSRQPPH